MTKKGFKEPNEIKKQYRKDKPVDGKPDVFSFTCPHYDQRSSCYMQAGTNYGVGMKQPIGHDGNPKEKVDVLPFGRQNTMKVSEVLK